jgi:hypothetical protein
VPGLTAPGGTVAFNGNRSVTYEAFIRGSETNATVPAALYVDHRADNWFTFFYNRRGSPEFTALSDG